VGIICLRHAFEGSHGAVLQVPTHRQGHVCDRDIKVERHSGHAFLGEPPTKGPS
jgi:hypothetical protein